MKIQDYPQVEIDFSPEIPKLKKPNDKTKVDIRYSLVSPFSYAHIYWDSKISELIYEIEEPVLNEEEEKFKEQITAAMRDMIDFESIVEKSKDKLLKYLHERFKRLAIELGMNISYESYKKIYYYLCRDFIGFNEADPLLRDYF